MRLFRRIRRMHTASKILLGGVLGCVATLATQATLDTMFVPDHKGEPQGSTALVVPDLPPGPFSFTLVWTNSWPKLVSTVQTTALKVLMEGGAYGQKSRYSRSSQAG